MKKISNVIAFINDHPLAGKHKCRAIFKFLKWQISQALYPKPRVVHFVEGTKLLVTKGQNGATGNIYTGLHEFSDMSFMLHLLINDDLFYDIGANVGCYSILAGGCKGSRVLAFEPISTTMNHLKKNIEINQLESLTNPFCIGLGSKEGSVQFTTEHDTINHVVSKLSIADKGIVAEVSIQSFDKIASKEGIPVLAKIDVEGFETEVIAGMVESLKSNELKAIILELNGAGVRYGFKDADIHLTLINNKFCPYSYDPFSRLLTPLNTFGTFNTIYIKDIEFVLKRIQQAKKIKVFGENI